VDLQHLAKRSPNFTPGRHDDLTDSSIIGLDLRVIREADRDPVERHRVVQDVDDWAFTHCMRFVCAGPMRALRFVNHHPPTS